MNKVALTLRGEGKLQVLKSAVGILLPYTGNDDQRQVVIEQFDGIWDTGATNSVITEKVVKKLGLKPIGLTNVHTASGTDVCNVFLVNVALPSNVMVPNVRVTQGILTGTDVLIGMDIIGLGDFSITCPNGQTIMSFRVPSCAEIDYVKDIEKERMRAYLPKSNERKNKRKKR